MSWTLTESELAYIRDLLLTDDIHQDSNLIAKLDSMIENVRVMGDDYKHIVHVRLGSSYVD